MFRIEKGTPARAIREGLEWLPGNFMDLQTKNDCLFDKNQIVLDPIGKLGCRQNGHVIGGCLEKMGYYGFRKGKWTLIVHITNVRYMD
jgi:hypothetical protein